MNPLFVFEALAGCPQSGILGAETARAIIRLSQADSQGGHAIITVIVVGAGNAALPASVSAHDSGAAPILVVDKASAEMRGADVYSVIAPERAHEESLRRNRT